MQYISKTFNKLFCAVRAVTEADCPFHAKRRHYQIALQRAKQQTILYLQARVLSKCTILRTLSLSALSSLVIPLTRTKTSDALYLRFFHKLSKNFFPFFSVHFSSLGYRLFMRGKRYGAAPTELKEWPNFQLFYVLFVIDYVLCHTSFIILILTL